MPKATELLLRPIRDNIIVKPDEPIKKTSTGFILTESIKKDKLRRGVVVAAGPGIGQPMIVKVGDQVVLSQYGPNEIEHDGEKYFIAPQYDVLAIIPRDSYVQTRKRTAKEGPEYGVTATTQ